MKRARMFMLLFCFTLFFSSTAMAQFPIVNAEHVKSLMEGKKKVVLIDSRTAEEYQQAHIPGAINIMPDHVKAKAASLPRDKTVPIIFYCRGMS